MIVFGETRRFYCYYIEKILCFRVEMDGKSVCEANCQVLPDSGTTGIVVPSASYQSNS